MRKKVTSGILTRPLPLHLHEIARCSTLHYATHARNRPRSNVYLHSARVRGGGGKLEGAGLGGRKREAAGRGSGRDGRNGRAGGMENGSSAAS